MTFRIGRIDVIVLYPLCLFIFIACGTNRLSKKGIYSEVTAAEYALAIRQPGINLIDVRTAAEYQKSHLANAVNINYFSGKFKKSVREANLDPSLPTYIYCETQHRSLFAAKVLYRQGFRKIYDLDKGMGPYREANLPYISGN